MLEWTKHPILPIPTDEEIAEMEPDELLAIHEVREQAIRDAQDDPYRYGFRLPHWERAEEQLKEVDEILASGGNRCLAPEQLIYDPVDGTTKPVCERTKPFHVEAWDGEKLVVAEAEPAFPKHEMGLFEFTLCSGEQIRCSETHLFLTDSGWVSAGDLDVGDRISSPYAASHHQSTEGYTPSVFPRDGDHYNQTAQGSQGGCHLFYRSCDEPPRASSGSDRVFLPLQGDAQECIWCASAHSGGLGNKSQCSRPCSLFSHLSILGVLRRFVALCAGTLSRAFYRLCRSAWRLFAGLLPQTACQRSSAVSTHQRSVDVSGPLDNQCHSLSAWSDHDYYRHIVKSDYLRTDTVWDFTVPIYHNYVAAGVISHNSGKTAWGSFCVVKAAIENPKSIIMCFAQTSEVSVRQQQSAVYQWLPPEYRRKQTGASTYISYTVKNGFTDNSFILPNGSQVIFKTYSQYQNNPTILEGAELGCKDPVWHNIGCWLDEYLLGEDLIGTLRFRLATRNAKMLVTFTPIDGWTEVIKDYLDKAKTIETREAELINGELVPYVQRSHNRNASIHYFHTKDNPFGGYDRIKNDLKGRPREEILIRAYGVPVKSQATKFPKFNKEVNVIPQDMVPDKDVTRYCIIDPAGSKNWFICWIAVDATNTYYVYREWPDSTIGDWAEWKGGKWASGQGAKGMGYGIKDYVRLILDLEDGEEIYERIIDPRLGAAKYQAQDGSSSIIEDLAENDIVCIPAPGIDIEDGIQALISKMSYDTTKPLDSVNRPRFYVTDECFNIINALSEYTGDGGLKEAWKDPIDVLRYASVTDIDHVDTKKLGVTRIGAGGY